MEEGNISNESVRFRCTGSSFSPIRHPDAIRFNIISHHNVELDEKTRSVIGNRSPLEDAGAGVTDGHVASEQNQDEQEERGRRRRTPSLSSSATALCRHRGRGGAAAEAVVALKVVQMM